MSHTEVEIGHTKWEQVSKPKGTRRLNYYWRQWIKADRIGQLIFLFANKGKQSYGLKYIQLGVRHLTLDKFPRL